MSPRKRQRLYALLAIVVVWVITLIGYAAFKHSQMTSAKLRAYLEQNDLSKLSGDARAKALKDLAAKINALSAEERRGARGSRVWDGWFSEMTESEKSDFLDATLPTGFKHMLAGFEAMTPDRQKRAIDNAVKRLKDARENGFQGTNTFGGTNSLAGGQGTNQPPVLSEELQKKVAMIGLKSVYSDSSAQTKAQLAPLLEELQKSMESGQLFRGR